VEGRLARAAGDRVSARAGSGLLVVALLALAGCATRPAPRDAPPAPDVDVDVVATEPSPAPFATPAPPAPDPARRPAPVVPPPPDVWQRARAGFAFATCPGSSASRRWQRTYTKAPDRFAALLDRALPLLEFVLTRIEARGLPTEFALLPLVESQYTPFPARGNRPAGVWQLMPVTARGLGLEIEPTYDGRLDAVAATDAALDLLEHLRESLGPDWRLVDMAFNAGEYRVRGALRSAGGPRHDVDPERLAVSRITHEHLAKLNALACVVREPRRHGVELPPLDASRTLAVAPVDADTDLELVAALAGLDVHALRALNPAHFGTTVAAGRSVLLPAAARARYAGLSARLDPSRRIGWRRATPPADATWGSLAAAGGVELAVLVALNADVERSTPSSRVRLLPPGAAGVAAAAPSRATGLARSVDGDGRYRVRRGDSLWRIARAFRVTVAQLLEWNGLSASKPIQPGQWLRVIAPER
jgi:membrane-bound lytic murein transglycosylase D